MNKKEFNSKDVELLEVKADGKTNLEFSKSVDNNLYIIIEYDDKVLKVKDQFENNFFKIKIYDENKKNKNIISDFIKSTNNISSFIGFLEKNSHQYKNRSTIKIELPSKLKDVKVKLNNGFLDSHYLHTDNLNIIGNNLKIKFIEDIYINNINIKANNSKIKGVLNSVLKTMKIKANNSKIKLIKMEDFLGSIKCKGNNIKKDGKLNVNSDIIVTCKINNSSIVVK